MFRIFLVMLLGAALFFGIAWQLKLFEETSGTKRTPGDQPKKVVATELGADLYKPKPFPTLELPTGVGDPVVLVGVMNPINVEEVPSLMPGKILFVGEQVDEGIVMAAGSLPFVSEQFKAQEFKVGGVKFVKFYRRLREGQTISRGQMLAMLDPTKAYGEVKVKASKVRLAKAELDAAVAGELEGRDRYVRAKDLYFVKKAISKEDYGAAVLTWKKLVSEQLAKEASVEMAETEKQAAEDDLHLHEIRALMPFDVATIKTIVRDSGAGVKQSDPVIVIQNLERLQAEALIQEQYFTRIRQKDPDNKGITATIEPTVVEAPLHELEGPTLDVTSVAVAKDMRIVAGSEDQSVCVWQIGARAPLKKLEHNDAVLVVACTPLAAKQNHCVAGCANGSITLWDLDDKNYEPIKVIKALDAHGADTKITALAFSHDGTLFASGASDGSIRMWKVVEKEVDNKKVFDVAPLYAFIPENGVEQSHEDAVTSLTFTPQCKLISAGRDKTLRVWSLKEKGATPAGKAVKNREGNVTRLGVSHDGKWMLFDQTRGRTLQLLSVENHTLNHTLNVPVNATPFDTLALFSPESKLILTAGAPEGRLQLWRTPDADTRGFEVRQFASPAHQPVTAAAFSPHADKGNANSFAVSASGQKIYVWAIPTPKQINEHRITDVPITLMSHTLDAATRQTRIGFEVPNPATRENPKGRFEAGRPVTIVID